MNEPPAIEWIYTLEKSIITKVFNQPDRARRMFLRKPTERSLCTNYFLIWFRTIEGRAFWADMKIENE